MEAQCTLEGGLCTRVRRSLTLTRPCLAQFSQDGLNGCIPDLPVEEQGLTHHLMVSVAVRMAEAMRLQLLVDIFVLAHAQWGVHSLGVKRRKEKESAE